MRLGSWTVFAVFAASLLGCPKKPTAAAEDGGVAATDAGAQAESVGGQADDDVKPVYSDKGPDVPLAAKFCEGLTVMPEKKRATCCKSEPRVVVTEECTHALSAALRAHAIELTEADVAKCLSAFEKRLDSCDWVGPWGAPPPAECEGIVRGKIALGQKCRSTLECAGNAHCAGIGPTSAGVCTAPKSAGQPCSQATDPLAGYTRQDDFRTRHPVCQATCMNYKCHDFANEGERCGVSSDCKPGLQCIGPKNALKQKKCVARALPKEGEACPGGVCEGSLQCISGKCGSRQGDGAACQNDFECRGGCLKPDGGTKGVCGMRCDIR